MPLGIAGVCVKLDYEDSNDAAFSVKNSGSGAESGGLNEWQGANAEYHASGLKYVVEASLQS